MIVLRLHSQSNIQKNKPLKFSIFTSKTTRYFSIANATGLRIKPCMSLAFGFRPLILTITGHDSHTFLGSETARELLLLCKYFQLNCFYSTHISRFNFYDWLFCLALWIIHHLTEKIFAYFFQTFFVYKRLISLKAFKNYFVLINWKIIMSSEEMQGDCLEDIGNWFSILKY